MTCVLSISSGRADLGALAPVWRASTKREEISLHVLLTGAHVSDPETALSLIPDRAASYVAGADPAGLGGAEAATGMASIIADTAKLCERLKPDVVLVMGDRIDMIPAALATVPFNLPLMHLHGGEQTLGAFDDRIRHAITKLAHIHCVSNEDAAQRVMAMGEEPSRVHITGAPGLDTLLEAPALSATVFAKETGFDDIGGLRLVTVHPETNSPHPDATLDAVLAALSDVPAPTLFTAPNADPGSSRILARIESFVAERPWARFRATLGEPLFASALRHAAIMVGNSSSGIVEAGVFGLPVINVGGRQAGRLRGANVHDCPPESTDVAALLTKLGIGGRHASDASLYGDGCSGPRLADILANLPDRDALLAKRFHKELPAA